MTGDGSGPIGLLSSVWDWARHRPQGPPVAAVGKPPPFVAFPYGREQFPLLWTFMVVTAMEIAVIEVLVPWTVVRLILLALGLFGLLIMAGFVAANRTRPHIMTSDALHLRCGLLAYMSLPLSQVDSVSTGLGSAEYGPTISGDTLTLAVAGSTHATVILRTPLPFTAGKVSGDVRVVRFPVDDPAVMAQAIRTRLAEIAA